MIKFAKEAIENAIKNWGDEDFREILEKEEVIYEIVDHFAFDKELDINEPHATLGLCNWGGYEIWVTHLYGEKIILKLGDNWAIGEVEHFFDEECLEGYGITFQGAFHDLTDAMRTSY